MHWPWDYKGGVLFTKVGLINGKERKCIFSALSIFLFTAMGIYPDVGPFWMRMLKKFSGYMAFVSSSHLMFSSGVRLYLTRHDISLMGDSLYLFILSTHCIYAQLLFRFNQDKISSLFETLEDNLNAWPTRKPNEFAPPMNSNEIHEKGLEYPSKTRKHPGEAFLTYTLLQNNRFIIIYAFFSCCTSSLFPLIPIFSESKAGERLLPHSGFYLVNEQESPWYELLYIFLSYGAWVNAFYVPIFDCAIMVGFSQYIAAHYQALRFHLESMNDASEDFNFRKELIKAIHYHKNIIKYGSLVEKTFNVYLLYIYMAWALLLAFVLLQLTLVEMLSLEFFTIALVGTVAILNLFLVCYFPHNATEQSIGLPTSLYFTDWVHTHRENKIIINIFFSGIRKPFFQTTGKFADISLDIWMGVIKASYSFYTLMQNIND